MGGPFCPKHKVGPYQWPVSSWNNMVEHWSKSLLCNGRHIVESVGIFVLLRRTWLTLPLFIDHWVCSMLCLLLRLWSIEWLLKTLWPVLPEDLCFWEAPWQRLWFPRWKTYCLSSEAGPWSSRYGSLTFDCCPESDFEDHFHWCYASLGTSGSAGSWRNLMAPCDPEPSAWTWQQTNKVL